MKRVFISYAHEDGDFVDVLASKLKAEGLATWLDTDLYGGQTWRAEIDLAMREASAVIVVVSPEALRSDYVKYEWAFALGAGVNVIPLLLRVDVETLHPALKNRQCLEFSNRLARPWDLLFRAVKGTGPAATPATIRLPADAPPVLEQAVRALDSMDENERKAALDTIQNMRHPALTEVLAAAATHPTEDVRIRAGIMLLERGDKRAVPAALDSLRAGWTVVGPRGFARLGKEIVPELTAALGDRSQEVREVAVRSLGLIGDRASIPAIRNLLADEKPGVVASAVEALGNFRDPSLLPVFAQALQKEETARPALRGAAGIAEGGEALLIEGLGSTDAQTRECAAELLAGSATEAALPALRAAMKDAENRVRQFALRAIARQKRAEDQGLLVASLDDDDFSVRHAAAEALTAAADSSITAALIDFVNSPEAVHRAEAVEILGAVGDSSAVPALIRLFSDPELKLDAVRSIRGRIEAGSPAVATLVDLLADADLNVRIAAAEALGQAADPAAVEPLSHLLDDQNPSVKDAANAALRSIGTPEARRAVAAAARR